MCVAGQVMQHMRRSAKRLLGVDDPLFTKQCPEEALNAFASDNCRHAPKA
jgi:hypothetical protein